MPVKTHCVHGHELTPENVYTKWNGTRECKACAIARVKESRRRRKAEQQKRGTLPT